jgi:hypothetical protein
MARPRIDSRGSIVAGPTDGGQIFVDAIAVWPLATITLGALTERGDAPEVERHARHRVQSATACRDQYRGTRKEDLTNWLVVTDRRTNAYRDMLRPSG